MPRSLQPRPRAPQLCTVQTRPGQSPLGHHPTSRHILPSLSLRFVTACHPMHPSHAFDHELCISDSNIAAGFRSLTFVAKYWVPQN